MSATRAILIASQTIPSNTTPDGLDLEHIGWIDFREPGRRA